MAHTPAPWKVDGKYTYNAIFGGDNNSRLVAEVPDAADAALIAAAPELLAALKDMVEAQRNGKFYATTINNALSAIAKAGGAA